MVKQGRVIKGTVVSLMIVGMCAEGASAVGNISDTEYSAYSTNGIYTNQREKRDYTSSYIYHKGNVGINVSVYSRGVNCSLNGSAYSVNVNEEKLIPNLVKEKGGVDCYLFLRQKASAAYTLYGLWSPDSINIK